MRLSSCKFTDNFCSNIITFTFTAFVPTKHWQMFSINQGEPSKHSQMFLINQGEPSKHSQMFLINQGEPRHRHRLPRGDHLHGRHELERRQSCSKTRSGGVGEEQRRVLWKKEEGCRRSGISPIKIWKSRLPRPRGCQRFGKLLTRSNGCEHHLWLLKLSLSPSSLSLT